MNELHFAGDLTDVGALTKALAVSGLSADACASRAKLFAQAAKALAVADPSFPCAEGNGKRLPMAFFVPGRIEVLGKHTDYAGGRTMVVVVERGFCITALPRDDRQIVVIDAATGETVVFQADPELKPQVGTWSNYPMTIARRVARNFPGATRGADIAFVSDLPPASGMSSSSAFLVGTFLVLSEINRLSARDEYWHNIGNSIELAGYLGTCENGQTFGTLVGDRGVGTFGGSEDQNAILNAEPNMICQYAFCPVEFEKTIPVPRGYVFAVGSSGVVSEKTGAAMEKYNRASRLASTLAELWRRGAGRDDPHLAAALGSAPDAADRLKEIVRAGAGGEFSPEDLLTRLEHFMVESGEIIPAAGDALAGGDLRGFGRWVDRSQHATEHLLGNQVPETVFLAASARKLGAAAASAFGAGFGGSVWALVETAKVAGFLTAWADEYHKKYPEHAKLSHFFASAAGPASFRVC
jgi:galactokinase